MTLAHLPHHHADRCPARAEHVLRAARKWSAQPSSTQRAHGPPRELPLVVTRVRLPRRPRVALRHVHVRPPSIALCFWLTIVVYTQVILVSPGQRHSLLIAGGRVR
jgi:hypothetical protein